MPVLEGDPKCRNLIEDSVYDTNPVHSISMVLEEFKGSQRRRSASILRQVSLNVILLSMKYINKYNNEMGGVDIYDKLRK